MTLNLPKILHQIAPSIYGVDCGLDRRRIEVLFPKEAFSTEWSKLWGQPRCAIKFVLARKWPVCAADIYLNLVLKTNERMKIRLNSSMNFHGTLYSKTWGNFYVTILEYISNRGSCMMNSCIDRTLCDVRCSGPPLIHLLRQVVLFSHSLKLPLWHKI